MPVGDVLIGNSGRDIEHDDTALSVDIISITKTTKLFLTGGIPNIELDLAQVLSIVRWFQVLHPSGMCGKVTYRGKAKRMDLNTECCDVLLLKFASQMAFDESGL